MYRGIYAWFILLWVGQGSLIVAPCFCFLQSSLSFTTRRSTYSHPHVQQQSFVPTASAVTASSSSSSDHSPSHELNHEVTNTNTRISSVDVSYMKQALSYARLGLGNTFPNPAVGCVLVLHNTNNASSDTIIGCGFHPKAGYPHAEIFALWEACGWVSNGTLAASSVVQHTHATWIGTNHPTTTSESTSTSHSSTPLFYTVQELLSMYSNPKYGPRHFFSNIFIHKNVTAYVTLEPCCHYGKTPPCAMSLVEAGVTRVVVGYRDPNPKVNGGGVALLRNQENTKIQVDVFPPPQSPPVKIESLDATKIGTSDEDVDMVAWECYSMVQAFVKRIAPRKVDIHDGYIQSQYETYMNGAKRSFLRSLAGKWKQQGNMMEWEWPTTSPKISIGEQDEEDHIIEKLESIELNHNWIERVDASIWEKELVLLRLSQAISKRKYVKILGERIAKDLGAHVVQVVGHTVLLYRPGRPPMIDFVGPVDDTAV